LQRFAKVVKIEIKINFLDSLAHHANSTTHQLTLLITLH
jgi:hypothetical protein